MNKQRSKTRAAKGWLLGAMLSIALPLGTMAATNGYTFSKSSAAYQDLSGATAVTDVLAAGLKVPIGFNFNCAGITNDSLYLRANGTLVFDAVHSIAFIPLSAYGIQKGNVSSSLSYKVSGSEGSRILKVQMKNFAVGNGGSYANLQIWLYEGSNKVEFRLGTSSVPDHLRTFAGVLNHSLSGTPGSIVYGNPSSPSVGTIGSIGQLFLESFPQQGTVYSFIP